MKLIASLDHSSQLFQAIFSTATALEKEVQALEQLLKLRQLIPEALSNQVTDHLQQLNGLQDQLLQAYTELNLKPPSPSSSLTAEAGKVSTWGTMAHQRQAYLEAYEFYQSFHSTQPQLEALLEKAKRRLALFDILELPEEQLEAKYKKYLQLEDLFEEKDEYKRFQLIMELHQLFPNELLFALNKTPHYFYTEALEASVEETVAQEDLAEVPATPELEATVEAVVAPEAESTTEVVAIPEAESTTEAVAVPEQDTPADVPVAPESETPAEAAAPEEADPNNEPDFDYEDFGARLTAALAPYSTDVQVSSSPKAQKKVTASTLKSLEKNQPHLGGLIKLTTMVNFPSLAFYNHLLKNEAFTTTLVTKLYNQGIIEKYTLEGYPDYYSFAPSMFDLMKTKNFQTQYHLEAHDDKHLSINYRKFNPLNLICCNQAFDQAHEHSQILKKCIPRNTFLQLNCFIKCFLREIGGRMSRRFITAVGLFATTEAEIRHFIKDLIRAQANRPIGCIIIVAMNKDHAQLVRECIQSSRLLATLNLLYTICGDANYYNFDHEIVNIDELAPDYLNGKSNELNLDVEIEVKDEENPGRTIKKQVTICTAENKILSIKDIDENKEEPLPASDYTIGATVTLPPKREAAEAKEALEPAPEAALENAPNSTPKAASEETPKTTPEENAPPAPKLEKEPAAEVDLMEATPVFTARSPVYYLNNFYKMLIAKDYASASAYMYAAAQVQPSLRSHYQQLAYALDDPLLAPDYAPSNLYNYLTSDPEPWQDHYLLATIIRCLFFSPQTFDYEANNLKNLLASLQLLQDYPEFQQLLDQLISFSKEAQSGPSKYAAVYSAENGLENLRLQLQGFIKQLQENYISHFGKGKHTRNNDRYVLTREALFDEKGQLAQILQLLFTSSNPTDPETVVLIKESLCALLEQEDYSPSMVTEAAIGELINRAWAKVKSTKQKTVRRMEMANILQDMLVKHSRIFLGGLVKYITMAEAINSNANPGNKKLYDKTKAALLRHISALLPKLQPTSKQNNEAKARLTLLSHLLQVLQQVLQGTLSYSNQYYYLPFLAGFQVTLNRQLLPCLKPIEKLPLLHPLMAIERHFDMPKLKYQEVLDIILKSQDYYGSAEILLAYLEEAGQLQAEEFKNTYKYAMCLDNAAKRCSRNYRDFTDKLELRRSYGQLDDLTVEDYKLLAQEVYQLSQESQNYQLLTDALDQLTGQLDILAAKKKLALEQEYQRIKSQYKNIEQADQWFKAVADSINSNNYAAAEDMLNRIENGDCDFFLEEEDPDKQDHLEELLANYDDYRNPVYKPGTTLANLVNTKAGGRNRESNRARYLVDSWLTTEQKLNTKQLRSLLEHLGFKPATVEEVNKVKRYRSFNVLLESAPVGRKNNYTHPVAPFGSLAEKHPFRVICVFGNYDAEEIRKIFEADDSTDTLILIDSTLDLPQRRHLARESRQKNQNGHICAVLDRVIINYLRRNYQEININSMLMELIIPFSYYQPYIAESAITMPPEIFVGRTKELAKIASPTGVNMVYGGRQLGKSALLRQVWKNTNDNEYGHKALLIDIKNKNVDQTALALCQELKLRRILPHLEETTDWQAISSSIFTYLSSGKTKYLLVLFDEADAFIEDCARSNYAPIDELKQLQNKTENGFKFVIAGLRDIIRFNQQAIANNSSLPQLAYLTVRPFKYAEAQELLTRPLYYSGFRFPQDQECQRLMSTIFATTNYFPGLIQLYCRELLEVMGKKTYGNFNEAETPPYCLSEGLISHVLGQELLTKEIKEKFNITLEIDGDKYYKIIALIVALLYQNNGHDYLCTPQQVLAAIEDWSIKKMAQLTLDNIKALMEELCELNILHSNGEGSYRFARQNFYQLMGSQKALEDQLMAYMED